MNSRYFRTHLRVGEGEGTIVEFVLKLAPFVVDPVILDDRRNQTEAAKQASSALLLSVCVRHGIVRQS
jgi:hypothetical protein